MPPHRRRQHFRRELQERPVEPAQEHDRPFREARKFLQQGLVGRDGEAGAGGEHTPVMENALAACPGVEDHPARQEPLRVVRELADGEHLRRVERVGRGFDTSFSPAETKGHRFSREQAQDPPQRADPTELAVTPAHGFLPGQPAHHRRKHILKQALRGHGWLFAHRKIELTLR